jgi:hypothetical protein
MRISEFVLGYGPKPTPKFQQGIPYPLRGRLEHRISVGILEDRISRGKFSFLPFGMEE